MLTISELCSLNLRPRDICAFLSLSCFNKLSGLRALPTNGEYVFMLTLLDSMRDLCCGDASALIFFTVGLSSVLRACLKLICGPLSDMRDVFTVCTACTGVFFGFALAIFVEMK